MRTEFPYKAWVLMPSFKPVEVEIVDAPAHQKAYRITDKGKYYDKDHLFSSKADAIKHGRQLVEIQKADLEKRHTNLMKRVAALDKAE